MIQTIGLLLCVYLVFKGIEIFQIPFSNPNSTNGSKALGMFALIMSIVIAAAFALLLLLSGVSLPNSPVR